jgi:lipid II:glycine glycyltransferase (peptidoglycan interpeptide bridge formation enzyme)
LYLNQTKLRGTNASNEYHAKLFKLIYDLPKDFRKLWLVQHDNDIIGGAIIFYKKNVTYWHGANSNLAKKYGGSHILQFEIMKSAKSEGFKYYDFSPSGGHVGVTKFKKGFGTKRIHFHYQEVRTKKFIFCQKIFQSIKAKLT